MKILHVAYSLGESSAATRLAEIQNEKHTIHFFLGRLSKHNFIRERQIYPYTLTVIGITLHFMEIFLCRLFGVIKGEIFSFGYTSLMQRWLLRRAISKFKFDVVHLHWGGYGFFPISALEGLPIRKVITAHDYHCFTGGCHVPMGCEQFYLNCAECPIIENKYFRSVAKHAQVERMLRLQKMDITVTTPSNYTMEYISRVHKTLDIRVIPNVMGSQYPRIASSVDLMIDIFTEHKLENLVKLVVVGVSQTTRENKGFDVLSYVIERLKEEQIQFKVMVIGDSTGGEDKSIYENYGSLKSGELARVYAVADLCLVPSRYETFSQVTLEAIVCGTPVVAFDLTGPKDIISDGITGFLAPRFDKEGFYCAVKNNLYYKRKNLYTLRKKALEVAEQYSGRTIIDAFDEVYGNTF